MFSHTIGIFQLYTFYSLSPRKTKQKKKTKRNTPELIELSFGTENIKNGPFQVRLVILPSRHRPPSSREPAACSINLVSSPTLWKLAGLKRTVLIFSVYSLVLQGRIWISPFSSHTAPLLSSRSMFSSSQITITTRRSRICLCHCQSRRSPNPRCRPYRLCSGMPMVLSTQPVSNSPSYQYHIKQHN